MIDVRLYFCVIPFIIYFEGSDLEKKDLKKAYLEGEGDMDYITDSTPFARVSDEPRLIEILQVLLK